MTMQKSITRYRLLLPAAFLVFGLASCEKIIDISIPDKERKIVVNGLIQPDQPVRINLSQSLSVLEKDSALQISGAVVNLYSGTNLVGKFLQDSAGFYSLPGFLAQAGESYRLTASYGALKPVEATAVLPAVVPIISVDTTTIYGPYGPQDLQISVTFKDPPGVHNLYSLGGDMTYTEFDYHTMTNTGKKVTQKAYIYANNSDQFVKDETTNFNGSLYFNDLLFDGLTKTVTFDVRTYSSWAADTIWLDVRLEQIDPSYYLYIMSYNAYYQAHNNPLSEPVQVYTNVKDGFGIFSGSSSSDYPIIIYGKRKLELNIGKYVTRGRPDRL
jgi:hypothetical protein